MKIKKLEFETSKGRFVVEEASDKNLGRILLKHITEEQASDIVDSEYNISNYVQYNPTAIYRLHSLIKSKGWYLENPYGNEPIRPTVSGSERHKQIVHFDFFKQKSAWQEAESRTLHNPVVFKIK